jgi:hypothetical protein
VAVGACAARWISEEQSARGKGQRAKGEGRRGKGKGQRAKGEGAKGLGFCRPLKRAFLFFRFNLFARALIVRNACNCCYREHESAASVEERINLNYQRAAWDATAGAR